MFYGRSFLKNCALFFKSIHGLWVNALLFINVIVPLFVYINYRYLGNESYAIQDIIYFFIPLFSVWTGIFVSQLFFSDETKDVFFFLKTKEKLIYIVFFYLIFLLNSIIITACQFYCLPNVGEVIIKVICVSVFYFGLSLTVMILSKSSTSVVMILILYDLLNIFITGDVNFFLFYINYDELSFATFAVNYIPLIIFGIFLPVFVMLPNRKKVKK